MYCSGRLRNGEQCRQMLASYVGGGLFVLTRDRMIALVGDVRSIRCPICQADNVVQIDEPQTAVLVRVAAMMETLVMSGVGQNVA